MRYPSIIDSGLATEVVGLISAGKEADVYLTRYSDALLAVKVFRLYRTSHRGGRPIKIDSTGWLAAHEFDMLYQAWKGGALVPTPAKRVENLFSMRYLGGELGLAPRLYDSVLDDSWSFLKEALDGIAALAKAGVVHSDLSPYNILVFEDRPWFIDLSEAIRVDRLGYSRWQRLDEAKRALDHGLGTIIERFDEHAVGINSEDYVNRILRSLDRFGVLGGTMS